MIISRAEIDSAISAYRALKRKRCVATLAHDTAEGFDPSDAAVSLGELMHAVVSDPFYRPELVEALGQRISEGRYYVPADEIVDKLLGRLIVQVATA